MRYKLVPRKDKFEKWSHLKFHPTGSRGKLMPKKLEKQLTLSVILVTSLMRRRDRCYAAVAADPMKPIFQIYKDLRTDIGRELTDEERKSFNCEIQELYSLKVQLYKHRRKFIPKAPQSFVSYIIYL